MNFKKSLIKVFSVNFLQLITGIIVGLVIPVVLDIENYADLKTYTLYIAYITLFHFGFIDGLYIKYGGKKFEEIDKAVLKGEHNFFIILELVISSVLVGISIWLNNVILFLFSISILPIMVNSFFINVYQATGEFDKYSKIIYRYTVSYLILNILLAMILKNKSYIFYCLTTYISNILAIISFEYKFIKDYKNEKAVVTKEILDNIKVGFFVLLGNLSVIALFGIDKWFVKLFLGVEDFAYYSFAVSMLNIINVLVNAISITFYNYLALNNETENINKLKKYLITLGGGASLGFFVLSFIVNTFIKKYIPSLDIIAITFAVFPYMILINALYVNLYKVNKDEKKYFKVVISMLGIATIYNIIAIVIFGTNAAIAMATIFTLITWVIYSGHDLKKVTTEAQMYIYMFCLTIFFLICTHYFNWLIGGIIYLIGYFVFTCILNKEVLIDLKKTISEVIKYR